jgi:hypothetical protein
MRTTQSILANAEVDSVLAQWRSLSAATREVLIILGAAAVVTVWVMVWALFFRKSHRRQHRHHHGHHYSQGPAVDAGGGDNNDDASQPPKRRKWRRPRREHRPRNPTLAETGGLPPARTGEPPEIQP